MTLSRDADRADHASTASAVADDLARTILRELAPGSSMPSEAELTERYGVSRLTIREAVKLLEGRGLLELSRGRKALVREPDGAAYGDFLTSVIRSDPKGLFDLIEVRQSLEVQSATLAAKRSNRAAIAAIESALQGMRDVVDNAEKLDPMEVEARFHTYDVGFHEAIALASGNRILGFLFDAMSAPLREAVSISRRGHEERGHTLTDTLNAHQKVLDAIRAGNSRAAADAMRLHLKDTERDIRMAMTMLSGQRTDRP